MVDRILKSLVLVRRSLVGSAESPCRGVPVAG
jgi:hypothetical protein